MAISAIVRFSAALCLITLGSACQLFPSAGSLPASSGDASSSTSQSLKKNCATKFGNQVDSISQGSVGLNPCAIRNGRIKCWGLNNYGELGLGDTVNRGDSPDQMGACLDEINLGSGSNAVSIAESNRGNRCALLSDGSVKCWGLNYGGGLGLGDLADRIDANALGDNLPAINLGAGLKASALVAGTSRFCAILLDGRVKCWGSFTGWQYFSLNPGFIGDTVSDMGDNLPYVALPAGRTATKLAASGNAVCAILDDGSLDCWSRTCNPTNGYYNGPSYTCSDSLGSSIPIGAFALDEPVKDIALGAQFACAVLLSGHVRCWGENDNGELGQGDTLSRAVTTASDISSIPNIDLGTGRTATRISAGENHVCALLDHGDLKCWGKNFYGALGLGDTINRGDKAGQMGDALASLNLGSGRTAIEISSQVIQTCALLDDHTVRCWGANMDGRLGQGDKNNRGATSGSMGDALMPIPLW